MHTCIEIACDESGFSGTNLLDPRNRVFTHASVHLGASLAGDIVAEVRARFPDSAVEYKSRRLQWPAIEWLLGPSGPLAGEAHVHLIDKTFLVVRRLVDLAGGEPRYVCGTSLDRDQRATSMALALHRDGPARYGAGPWRAVLQAFVTLMRTKRNGLSGMQAYLRAVAALPAPGHLDGTVDLLRRAGPRIESLRSRLPHDPALPPPLEPLVPALLETARHWCARGRPVSIVHDEQSALTQGRIGQIQRLLDGCLHSVVRVDSRSDPRIQMADLLAGAARRIASAELRGQRLDEPTALLQPFVDPYSIWADQPSWPRLASPRHRFIGTRRPARRDRAGNRSAMSYPRVLAKGACGRCPAVEG